MDRPDPILIVFSTSQRNADVIVTHPARPIIEQPGRDAAWQPKNPMLTWTDALYRNPLTRLVMNVQ